MEWLYNWSQPGCSLLFLMSSWCLARFPRLWLCHVSRCGKMRELMFTEHLPVGLHYLRLIFQFNLSSWYWNPHFTNVKMGSEGLSMFPAAKVKGTVKERVWATGTSDSSCSALSSCGHLCVPLNSTPSSVRSGLQAGFSLFSCHHPNQSLSIAFPWSLGSRVGENQVGILPPPSPAMQLDICKAQS